MSILQTPRKIRNKIFQAIKYLEEDIVNYVHKPGRDFSRKRSCTFSRTIKTIMAMECHDLDKEIMSIFPACKKTYSRQDLVTASAFVQARGKINENAFPDLFNRVNQIFPFLQTKDGMHIIGIDGSDVNVPADIKDCNTFIPYNSNNGGYYQMHLNCAFDILEQRYSDIVVQPRAEVNEISAACEMVRRKTITGKCLYIADRGYFGFNLMAHIQEKGDYFLIRLKDIYGNNSSWKFIVPSEKKEFDIQAKIKLTRSSKKAHQDPTTYKYLSHSMDFDFIEKGNRISEYEIPFRLIAIKLDNGNYEYLITNLPMKIGFSGMKDYYHLRWDIEKSFLFLKYGVALNYFHSIKREFLIQEIYAKLIMYNFISLLVACVAFPDTNKNLKYKYTASFKDAITIGRDYLLGRINPEDVIPLMESYKKPIRPDRKQPRKLRSQRLRTLQNRS